MAGREGLGTCGLKMLFHTSGLVGSGAGGLLERWL